VGVTARDVMTREVRTVSADAPLREAMATMVQGRFSGLPVVEGDRVVGVITEGDIIKHLRRQVPWAAYFVDGLTMAMAPVPPEESLAELLTELRERPVREFMTPHVVSVHPDQDVREVARILVERRIKRVPVLEGRRLVGIITRGDLVRGMLQA
jgi:CBS domain-containing protein